MESAQQKGGDCEVACKGCSAVASDTEGPTLLAPVLLHISLSPCHFHQPFPSSYLQLKGFSVDRRGRQTCLCPLTPVLTSCPLNRLALLEWRGTNPPCMLCQGRHEKSTCVPCVQHLQLMQPLEVGRHPLLQMKHMALSLRPCLAQQHRTSEVLPSSHC